MIKNYLKNDFCLSIFNKIMIIILGFLSSAFSTRYLGLQYKGEYSYITQVANIFVLFLNLGIYQSYSYNYRIYGEGLYKKYADMCMLQFIVYCIIFGLLVLFSNSLTIALICVLVPFNILKIQFENIMLVENIRRKIFINIFNNVVLVIVYATLYFFFTPNLIIIIVITVIIDILTVICYLYKFKYLPKIMNIDFTFLKSVISFGFIPMITGVLSTLNYNIDIIFIKNMCTAEQLSIYSLVAGIMSYIWYIPDAFKDVLFSKVARSNNTKPIIMSSQLSLLFMGIAFVGFIFFGNIFLSIVYGTDFLPAYPVILVVFLGSISMAFFKLFGVVFLAEGRRYFYFFSLLISVVLNVILNFILIPVLNIYGAAIASVISYNVCGLTFLIYFSKVKNIKIRELIFIKKIK